MTAAGLPSNWSIPQPAGDTLVRQRSKHVGLSPNVTAVGEPIRWTLLLCSTTALLVSSYLAWVSLTSGTVAGCGGSLFNCDHVLHSRWSSVLSVPVSIPAILTHLAIISLVSLGPMRESLERMRWTIVGICALTAGAAAFWFVGLQIVWLQHLCPYCLVAHACGLIAAILILWSRPIRGRSLGRAVAAALGSVALLITLQSITPAPQTFDVIEHHRATEVSAEGAATGTSEAEPTLFEAPQSASESVPRVDNQTSNGDQRLLEQYSLERIRQQGLSIALATVNPGLLIHGQVGTVAADSTPQKAENNKAVDRPSVLVLNNVKLYTTQWPLLGKPDAELVFVELFDYTCPHCQRTHVALEGARKKYGDRLAVLALPVPLDRSCNPTVKTTGAAHAEACQLARLAIAVWTLAPEKFEEFHNYLFDAKPRYAAALSTAAQKVDAEKLRAQLSDPITSDYIAKHVALYQKAGGGTIPKLMFPNSTSVGEVSSVASLVNLIEQHLVGKQR